MAMNAHTSMLKTFYSTYIANPTHRFNDKKCYFVFFFLKKRENFQFNAIDGSSNKKQKTNTLCCSNYQVNKLAWTQNDTMRVRTRTATGRWNSQSCHFAQAMCPAICCVFFLIPSCSWTFSSNCFHYYAPYRPLLSNIHESIIWFRN